MKIAITGHSRGLGAEFKKVYESKGHTVTGFSRANGYDLRDWSKMQSMIDQIQDYDIFISCAKPDFVQTTILYELWKIWKGQNKLIINISSILTYMPTCPPGLFADPQMDLYRTCKLSLNEASSQLTFKCSLPNILLVKPSHLYDNIISDEQEKKLTNWVSTLITLIECSQKNNFTIKEITL